MARLLPALVLLAACAVPGSGGLSPGSEAEPPVDTGADDTEEPAFAASTRADLRPKRWRQLSLDLQGALELAEDDVCKETDRFQCTTLHVVQLGGISEDNGVYETQGQLPVTAGLSTERVVLKACVNRLERDREAEEPVVFGHIDGEGAGFAAAGLPEGLLEDQATELWRRLLARDPSPEELAGAAELHASVVASGGDNAAWAAVLCMALGTSTEALSY